MLRVQKRLASQILKCGHNKIRLDPSMLEEIKEAITKNDVRTLINTGAITKKRSLSTSRFRAKRIKKQKISSKRKGHGSRKGKKTARLNPKRTWMNKIRLQRKFIKNLRDNKMISSSGYHELYYKSKGGFFRSLRHIKMYTEEKGIVKAK